VVRTTRVVADGKRQDLLGDEDVSTVEQSCGATPV